MRSRHPRSSARSWRVSLLYSLTAPPPPIPSTPPTSLPDLETRHAHERERTKLTADSEASEEKRSLSDKEHQQLLRHWREQKQAELEHAQQSQLQELDYLTKLSKTGVDLTQYLVAREASRPSQHIRVDGAASALAKVHLSAPAADKSAGRQAGFFG
mmetsp:Transcript_14853/g.37569  ORF Transcript_14853/g.37569 Transcript_14853/m.37569 type:complete len:157 (-) Transcript_14853:313-783(-)